MEIIMPIGGAGYNFNNSYSQAEANTSESTSGGTNFDFNNYSFSYPGQSTGSAHHHHHHNHNHHHQPSYPQQHFESQTDHQRFDQSSMPNQPNRPKQDLNYPSNDESSNSNFTSVQYNQPRSGPLSNTQLEYSSINFQFPSNSYQSSDYSNFNQSQEQHHYQQHQPQLRSPLPPTQYSQIQTPNNVVPQSQNNSNFQYSSSSNQDASSNEQSPLYPPHYYQQKQSSYFPQYSEHGVESKPLTFNDPFANRGRTDGKLEEFTEDDVQILKSLLFNGEKIKWKYISSKLANVTGRRATSTACSKKTRELFRLPNEQCSGDLGTSLPYVVHNSWKILER